MFADDISIVINLINNDVTDYETEINDTLKPVVD